MKPALLYFFAILNLHINIYGIFQEWFINLPEMQLLLFQLIGKPIAGV